MRLLAVLFAFLSHMRNLLYDRAFLKARRLPAKVISVGNIMVGGTGKSPMVIALARYYQSRGERVAILTRGYRSRLKSRDYIVLKNGAFQMGSTYIEESGADEALMQSFLLVDVPVIVGARRFAAAVEFLRNTPNSQHPTIYILDDGFQHRKIARDLDIAIALILEAKGGVLSSK